MLWPSDQGDYESWDALAPTLMPFLEDQVGNIFLPWTVANTQAMMAGKEEFTVALKGQNFTQIPQKYHVKSLQVLRDKYAAVSSDTELASVLEAAGCLAAVQA